MNTVIPTLNKTLTLHQCTPSFFPTRHTLAVLRFRARWHLIAPFVGASDMSQGYSQGFFLFWGKIKWFTTQGIPITQTIRRFPLDTFREMVSNVEYTQKDQDQDAWPRPRHLGKIKTSNKIKTNSKTKSSGKTKDNMVKHCSILVGWRIMVTSSCHSV